MCDFSHRLLRNIVPRSWWPDEWDWDALRSFHFVIGELLSVPSFMQKTEFRAKALKVDRTIIEVELERGRKTKSDAVVKAAMGESFNSFIDQGRQNTKYVSKGLLRTSTFKSELVIGLACFDFGVLFESPKTLAVDCYQHVFQSFSSRGWLAQKIRNVRIDDYVEFVDALDMFNWMILVLDQPWRTWFCFHFRMFRIITEGVFMEFVQIVVSLLEPCCF